MSVTEEPLLEVPYTDLHAAIRHRAWNDWSNKYKYSSLTSPNTYNRFFPVLNKKPSILKGIPRPLFISYFRILVGHGNYNKLRFKRKLSNTPLCACDNESDEYKS